MFFFSLSFFPSFFQDGGGPELQQLCAANDSDGPPEAAALAPDKIAAARSSTRKALDCQTFIMSLSTKGTSGWRSGVQTRSPAELLSSSVRLRCADVAHFCRQLRLLESPLSEEMDAMIGDAGSEDSTSVVRDFKSRLDAVTLAYDPLTKRLLTAAESSGGGSSSSSSSSSSFSFPMLAIRDAAKAEMHANMLYSWARTFMPKAEAAMDKASKLRLMPYVVAMAYAVRVKLDVYYVESSNVNREERLEYLERSRSTVEQFLQVLQTAVRVTLRDSSLLDVALDYHLVLTTYIALMAALRASVQMILKSKDAPKTIAIWDDGLVGIR